jgi:flagellar protein FliL
MARDLHPSEVIMASSPTTLVDPANSQLRAAVEPYAKTKLSAMSLLLVGMFTLAISVWVSTGIVYYLVQTGRLSTKAVAPQKSPDLVVATHALALEPLLVNLADPGGGSYLRIAVTLRLSNAEVPNQKNEKHKEDQSNEELIAAARDTILTVLGTQTSETLLAATGKERLKSALKTSLSQHNPELKVLDVFFTDFIVQR